jgi:hypothetical protein
MCSTAPAEARQTSAVTCAARRNDDAGCARARRRAGDGAQVARVGDLVEAGDQRTGGSRQLVGIGVAVGLDPGHDALVLARQRRLREVALGLDLEARGARLREPGLVTAGALAHPQLEHLARPANRLAHRISTVDELAMRHA